MSKEFIKLTECRQTAYTVDHYLDCVVRSSEIVRITEEIRTGYSIIQFNTGKYITVKETIDDIMEKIYCDIKIEYDRGDLVIFKKDEMLLVGIIEGYYIDNEQSNSILYNVRVNKDLVYTYSNDKNITELDILTKINANGDIIEFFAESEDKKW